MTGAIALVFMVVGYQVALFINKAALTRIVANRDNPDTVYIIDADLARSVLQDMPQEAVAGSPVTVRRNAPHSEGAQSIRAATRRVESFPFDPNTVSVEELQRLGFSERQALAIDNYRSKGGRFRRKEDFARSYVVADSVYERLAPWIRIPRIDINRADSAALLALPGIGPYFAGKVVSYRNALRGYSYPEQLLEIYHFDREKYDALADLISCSAPEPYPLWTLSEEELSKHPYLSRAEAHGVVLYRSNQPAAMCTIEGLLAAGVISREHAAALSRCRISAPPQES